MRGNFEFVVDTFAIVLDKWMRNGFPKWKMSQTKEFKMNSYCEFLSYIVQQGTKFYTNACFGLPMLLYVGGEWQGGGEGILSHVGDGLIVGVMFLLCSIFSI